MARILREELKKYPYGIQMKEKQTTQNKKSGENRLISRNAAFKWPPYSPDLNPLDFFLWGYLKSRVYRSPYPKTVEELKKSIRSECGKITKDMIVSAVENFNARMQYVISKKWAWFEQIMNS